MTKAEASGKVILFGEHAVVYGRPAIAVPVTQVRACATVADAPTGQGIMIHAEDLGRSHLVGTPIDATDPAFALEATVQHTLDWLGYQAPLDLTLTICSTVPIARGLGSGAAVATALVRALTQHLGHSPTARQVCDLVYQTEILHHGTPSGIDNTVIAFEQPVYFVGSRLYRSVLTEAGLDVSDVAPQGADLLGMRRALSTFLRQHSPRPVLDLDSILARVKRGR